MRRRVLVRPFDEEAEGKSLVDLHFHNFKRIGLEVRRPDGCFEDVPAEASFIRLSVFTPSPPSDLEADGADGAGGGAGGGAGSFQEEFPLYMSLSWTVGEVRRKVSEVVAIPFERCRLLKLATTTGAEALIFDDDDKVEYTTPPP